MEDTEFLITMFKAQREAIRTLRSQTYEDYTSGGTTRMIGEMTWIYANAKTIMNEMNYLDQLANELKERGVDLEALIYGD